MSLSDKVKGCSPLVPTFLILPPSEEKTLFPTALVPLLHLYIFPTELCDYSVLCCTYNNEECIYLNCSSFFSPTGVQPLPVWQCVDAGQCLLQEAGGQEMAQYGQSQLHEEVHQAMERRVVHAGHHPEGILLCNYKGAVSAVFYHN